jgi:hypothetical protein
MYVYVLNFTIFSIMDENTNDIFPQLNLKFSNINIFCVEYFTNIE